MAVLRTAHVDIYYVLQFINISPSGEEWLSEHAFAHGALGMSEALEFEQPEGEETVHTRLAHERKIDVYFEAPPPPQLIEAFRATFPASRVDARAEQNKDWLAEWKKGFKPVELAGGHWVVPSWCESPVDARKSLFIDPGMAFGTGTHETTQLVARALLGIGEEHKSTFLDVGTGTGILAMLAHQLGFKSLTATEIEDDARRVAHENFERNGCTHVQMSERQIEDLPAAAYDVVVANIIDGVLVRLRETLLARVRPGGWLILSGIIREREPEFLKGFTLPSGRAWDLRSEQGDWLLYGVQL